jgi:hypothetical protein
MGALSSILKSQISNLKSIRRHSLTDEFDNQAICSGAPGFIREARKKLRMLITSPRIYQWERFLQFSNLKSQISNRLGPEPPDSSVKREKSSECSSPAPAFINGSAFFKSKI